MSPADRDMLEKTFVAECMAGFGKRMMDTSRGSMNRRVAEIMAEALMATIQRYEALKK